jgi:hypothetical protein
MRFFLQSEVRGAPLVVPRGHLLYFVRRSWFPGQKWVWLWVDFTDVALDRLFWLSGPTENPATSGNRTSTTAAMRVEMMVSEISFSGFSG